MAKFQARFGRMEKPPLGLRVGKSPSLLTNFSSPRLEFQQYCRLWTSDTTMPKICVEAPDSHSLWCDGTD